MVGSGTIFSAEISSSVNCSVGASTPASSEAEFGLISLVASAGMVAHDSLGVSSAWGKLASVSTVASQLLRGPASPTCGQEYWWRARKIDDHKKETTGFECDGDVGNQKTGGRASAKQNHAAWTLGKTACMRRSPNSIWTLAST